jgi:heme-degrading monooxygenase HmoA
MAFLLGVFDTGDYDKWKQMFDSDPAGRKEAGQGHRVFRSAEDPNRAFISVEFASADDAKAFRERLLASGALDKVTVAIEPTVVELVDETRY